VKSEIIQAVFNRMTETEKIITFGRMIDILEAKKLSLVEEREGNIVWAKTGELFAKQNTN
jgi:hypothetical protein